MFFTIFMGPSGLCLALFILICLSTFFSLAETAFVSVPEEKLFKLEQDGSSRAKMTIKLLSNKDKIISIALLCDNIANISASSISAVFFVNLFGEFDEVGIFISTVIMTILIFVFGEVLPKMIAIRQSTKIALSVTPIFIGLSRLLLPALWIINKVTLSIVKLFHIKNESDGEDINDSILGAVEMYHKRGVIEKEEKNMLSGILQLENIDMKDVMTHRSEMFAIDINENIDDILKKVIDNKYTKIPFYDKSDDEIIGVLNTIDLLKKMVVGKVKKEDLRLLLKEPWYLPGDASVGSHLQEFKDKGDVLAFIVDEFGGIMGIVSLEDMLEQIVGDINSNNGDKPCSIINNNDGSYTIDADASLLDVNDVMCSKFEDDEVSSIGGFLINKIEHIPLKDEEFVINGYLFKILETEATRILTLKIKKMDNDCKDYSIERNDNN